MEPDAAHTVLSGTLTASTAGLFFGATYGIVKRQSPVVHAFNASISSGLAGLTFFAFREYVAGPTLTKTIPWEKYRRRQAVAQIAAASQEVPTPIDLTFSEMRMHKLLDTAFAGSITGGILNFWKRGAAGVTPGAITAGIICTTAQLLWNELGVLRVKFVSRVRRHQSDIPPAPVRSRTFSEKLMDGLSVVLPIKKISDEEYMQKLLKEREEVERRLDEVQAELEHMTESKNEV